MVAGLIPITSAQVQLPEALAATGDEWAKFELLGECECVTVLAFSVFRGIAAGRDAAKKVKGARLTTALSAFAGQGQGSPGKLTSVREPVGEQARFAQRYQK